MPIGKGRGCSARSARTPSPSPSSCRRPTSPARCTSAMRSTIRCRTSSSATRGCRARTPVGGRHRPCRDRHPDGGRAQPRGAAGQAHRHRPRGVPRASLGVEGRERRRRSPASSAGSAPAATGRTSASPWTRASRSAVTQVFVELYKRGLAYRDKRLVNWDPKFQTAISDLEVETREVAGPFLASANIRSPTAAGAIHVATTRPETMLADMAVAVHPDDERYAAMVGKHGQASDHRPADPDRRRRACRSRARLGRGQDHAGP